MCVLEDRYKARGRVKGVWSQTQKQDHGNGLRGPKQEDCDLPSNFRQCGIRDWTTVLSPVVHHQFAFSWQPQLTFLLGNYH